jgi:hypothetical protein
MMAGNIMEKWLDARRYLIRNIIRQILPEEMIPKTVLRA